MKCAVKGVMKNMHFHAYVQILFLCVFTYKLYKIISKFKIEFYIGMYAYACTYLDYCGKLFFIITS